MHRCQPLRTRGLTTLFVFCMVFCALSARAQWVQIVHMNADDSGTLIIGPSKTLLIEAGMPGNGAYMLNILAARGVSRLDYFLAGHYHGDHIGCIDEIVAAGVPIVLAGYDRGGTFDDPEFPGYISAIGALRRTLALNDQIDLGGGCVLTCIAVNGQTNYGYAAPSAENDRSIAMVLRYGTFDYWIGSDMTGGGDWNGPTADVESLAARGAGDVDVYVADHHGLNTSSNQNLINILRPEHAVVNIGTVYPEPSQAVLTRLTTSTMKAIWQTRPSATGATSPKLVVGKDIEIDTDGTNINVTLSNTPGMTFTYTTDGIRGLAAPAGLSASAVSSAQINLSWSDCSDSETGFKVERSPDGVAFQQIGTAGPNATTYADTGLSPSTTYTYRVRASNATGNSLYTGSARATTQAASLAPPNPPGSLTVAVTPGHQVNLSWGDNSGNEVGFKVERSPDGVAFQQIGTVAANVTTYADSRQKNNRTLYYRVRAYNSAGDSIYSNVVRVTI